MAILPPLSFQKHSVFMVNQHKKEHFSMSNPKILPLIAMHFAWQHISQQIAKGIVQGL